MQRISKYILLITAIVFAILILGVTQVQAEKFTATTDVNGVTANWEYEINTTNNYIYNLVCTNKTDLTGVVEVPAQLNGINVNNIGASAFAGATNITGIVVPDTVKSISEYAFNGCTSLTDVDLGSVEKLYHHAFHNCTSLKNITIPRTLNDVEAYNGNTFAYSSPFTGETSLKNVTLEEGLTNIAPCLLAFAEIEEIEIPNTVTHISYSAFQNCESLKEIKLPNSVKTLEEEVFRGCTSLESIDLGSVEKITYWDFRDCPNLKSIKIPKTLNTTEPYHVLAIHDDAMFAGTTDITEVELEDGLRVISPYLLANTNMEEIEVPNSVTSIQRAAFLNCTNLKKITILDNVKAFGQNVFGNHNEDLTIYCYKDSAAHKYAVNNNIKYVLIEKPAEPVQNEPKEDPKDNSTAGTNKDENKSTSTLNGTTSTTKDKAKTQTKTQTTTSGKKDGTTATGILPKTGLGFGIIVVIIAIGITGVYTYKKFNSLKDIK